MIAPLMSVMIGACYAGEPGVSDKEIVLGQSLGITGPLVQMAPDILNGGKAYFESVNAHGGIFGRKIRTVVLDDGYNVDATLRNTQRFLNEDRVFALYNYTGTTNVAAVLPLLSEQADPVPLVGPITGADSVRQPFRKNVFHVRASYGDELEKLVEHLSTVGITRPSVLWINNGMGKDGMASMEQSLKKYSITRYASSPIQPDGTDAAKAVEALRKNEPEAVIMITTGAATLSFIRAFNSVQKGMKFYTLSVMGTSAAVHALGPDGVGVIVTSVVPFPWSASSRLAREYQDAMKKAGYDNLSFLGFESFINAKVIAEGIRRAGKDLTRSKFITALESIKFNDHGELPIGYESGKHLGSHFVELTMITSGERFTK
jgi:ABC-type branched-subunit amino acid transport system substrate-binding protein